MSAKQMMCKLARIERSLEIKYGKQEYECTSNGMFVVPANEVLSPPGGGSPVSFVNLMKLRKTQHLIRDFLELWTGEKDVLPWKLEGANRVQRHKDFGETTKLLKFTDEERETIEKKNIARVERLLKRRCKAERDSGRPVSFLFPFNPMALKLYLESGEKNPRYDARIYVNYLVPVYLDGTVGNKKLYPIGAPF